MHSYASSCREKGKPPNMRGLDSIEYPDSNCVDISNYFICAMCKVRLA